MVYITIFLLTLAGTDLGFSWIAENPDLVFTHSVEGHELGFFSTVGWPELVFCETVGVEDLDFSRIVEAVDLAFIWKELFFSDPNSGFVFLSFGKQYSWISAHFKNFTTKNLNITLTIFLISSSSMVYKMSVPWGGWARFYIEDRQ